RTSNCDGASMERNSQAPRELSPRGEVMWYRARPPGRKSNSVKVAGHPGGPQKRSSCRGSVNALHSRSTGAAKSATSVMVRASGFVETSVTGMVPPGRSLRGSRRRLRQQVIEAGDARPPQLFVSGEERPCTGDHLGVRADEALASFGAFDDEPCLFEHGHVLLDRGERHLVVARQLGHRLLALDRPAQDVAPGRRRQCVEHTVDLRFAEFMMYNHLVVRYSLRMQVSRGVHVEPQQIGRASCREREEYLGVAGSNE